jgi:hypothetical protein
MELRGGKQYQALSLGREERTATHVQCAGSGLSNSGERRIQILHCRSFYHDKAAADRLSGSLNDSQFPVDLWKIGIEQRSQNIRAGNQLTRQAKPSIVVNVTPVTLPPGRLRFGTKPV